MDKALFIPSACIAGILILIYAVAAFKKGIEFEQKTTINIILQSFQLVCGAVLIGSTIFDELATLVSDLNLYILIAGAVLLINAVQSISKDMKLPLSRNNQNNENSTESSS